MFGLAGFSSSWAENQSVKKHISIDWVSDPPNVNVCDGHYVLPKFTDTGNPNLVIHANESLFLKAGESELTGDVKMEEPDRRFFADKVTLLRNEAGEAVSADAQGGILLEEPDFRVWGSKADIKFENNATTVWDAEYRWYARQARGNASEAYTSDNEPLFLYDASYTTCPPDSNLWLLKSSKVVLNQETGRGSSWHTKMYMKDVPVMYVPYFNFPIDDRRQTGFLNPEFRSSTRNGPSLRTPYYLNLAPNYDATLYPYYMADRGLQMGGEFRFLTQQFYSTLYGEYLPHDRAFIHYRDRKLASTQHPDPNDPRRKNLEDSSSDRWLVDYNLKGRHGKHWRTKLEYKEVSDDEYLIDFGSNTFGDNERQLRRRAEARYANEELTGLMYVQDYQTLQPFESNLVNPPYQILPHGQLHYTPYMPEYPFVFSAKAQATNFDHDRDSLIGETPTYGQRYHVAPSFSFPRRTNYGFVIPTFRLWQTNYNLKLSPTDEALGNPSSISRTVPITSVDMGLFFERYTTWLNKSYLQTLEPRAFYLYVPYRNQNDIPDFDTSRYEFTADQLYRINRFSSIDRIGDANQVSLSLTTRYYDEASGAQKFKATVGQIVYFRNRDVTLCNNEVDPLCIENEDRTSTSKTSPIVADMLYRFNPNWYLSADLRQDLNNSETDLYTARFHYQPSNRRIIHVGLRYEESGNELDEDDVGSTTEDLIQSDIAVTWGISQRLSLLGRWYYDLRNDFTVDAFGGLEYESCCYAVRLGARRYLTINSGSAADREFDTEYFVQWIFKGLGSVGRSPVDYFTTTLPGYQDRFEVEI